MTLFEKRVFMRNDVVEEEITPPCAGKSRSFDSLSVAHILGSRLQDPLSGLASAAQTAPSDAASAGGARVEPDEEDDA